jgi:ferredoxin-NADP reductase
MAYIIKLLESSTIAEGTMAFKFEKPAGYSFMAGQATDWTLIDPPETDAEGNSRSFTICAAPDDAFLRLATRMRDTAFKRTLKNMKVGDTISIDDPWGEFTLHEDTTIEAVFLAGGIGVTPSISVIRDAALSGASRMITLFLSNRRPEDAPFMGELEEATKHNDSIRIIASMTEMEKSSQKWDGEKGFIDKAMLQRHLPNINKPIYYIAGPPQMVAAMKDVLLKAGIDETKIRLDDFLGY